MTDSDLNTLLFCSFRYALGRRTYIVDDIAELLLKYKDILHPIMVNKIKEEIDEAIESHNAGMICDVRAWLRVMEGL